MELPRSFFKFVSGDRAHILSSGTLRFTPAEEFNDPFELNPHLTHLTRCWIDRAPDGAANSAGNDVHCLDDDDVTFSMERYNSLPAYEAKLRERTSALGILSLSASWDTNENPAIYLGHDDDPRNNLLMWAHYAANHSGFVIEFSADFVDAEKQRVTYPRERPVVTFEDIDKGSESFHLHKGEAWKYENEWRVFRALADADQVVGPPDQPVHLFKFSKRSVKSVTFGCRAKAGTKDAVLQALQSSEEYRNTQIFTASIDPKAFALNIHQEIHHGGRCLTNAPLFPMQPIDIQRRPSHD